MLARNAGHHSMNSERLKPPSPAKYFFAFTFSEAGLHLEAERLIEERYGAFDFHSDLISFSDFSTYYDQELGGPCRKCWASLEQLRPVDQIVPMKLSTEEIEASLALQLEDRRTRTVNIDPGFLNGWQVVLATVKNHGHRIYLNHGVFCEVTLLYRHRAFQPLPWTYRDYLSRPALEFFRRVRSGYTKQIRQR